VEGDRIAEAMGDADVAFLKNHGVLVVGPSIGQAWDDLYYLERACEAECIALSTGRALKPVAVEVARHTANQMASFAQQAAHLHLESVKRRLDRDEPDYKD
jgi:ribulose-5-phosphate 4-epimerase/fuculose-1-phosphate aldolase